MSFYKYPHTDLNQGNLDWIIRKITDVFAGRGVVTSVNGQDGAVTISTPTASVTSVNGQTGDVTVPTIPSGGTAGQFLVKQSGTDYDAAWVTVPNAQGVSF